MTDNILRLEDRLDARDGLQISYKPSVLHRTKIIGGYDHFVDKRGISQLGEVLFDEENQIVLGGALFTLEKIFGIPSPLTVDYLNNIMNIATTGLPVTDIYPKANVVCLFGLGIGGCGDTIASIQDVKFYEREIVTMIPFRIALTTTLTVQEKLQYWFKRLDIATGKTSYYLKAFDSIPQIKVLWKDGIGDEDGTVVQDGVQDTTRTEPIETFVELILKISKLDVREYFQVNGNIEQTRINSIGLFTGVPSILADGSTDYKQVKLFSKLNINNEMLTLAKDLTIIYRIYTS